MLLEAAIWSLEYRQHKYSKNYKQKMTQMKMEKKGQIAIFVVIAIVIVGVILAVMLYPKLSEIVAPKEISPKGYLEDCIQPVLKDNVELLASQGGYKVPEGTIWFNDKKVKYLCYTSDYFKTCVVQEPMIKGHFEEELQSMLKEQASRCVRSMKTEYEKRGYSISLGEISSNVSIVSRDIKVTFYTPMTIAKEDTSMKFSEIDAEIESEMYDLLYIAHSIVDFESTYGDSETTTYVNYYPDVKVKKVLMEDGSKVYILSNIITKESFTFAVRSLVWPAGYGTA